MPARSRSQRDPWELEDDTPPPWRATIETRAAAIHQPLTSEARWSLFALQSLLADLRSIPEYSFIRTIVLYGPLANGVAHDPLSLMAVLYETTPASAHATIWEQLGERFKVVERTFALRVDCLITTEGELSNSATQPPHYATIEHDYVVVWPME